MADKLDIPKRYNPEKALANGKKPKKYFSKMFICINCGRIWVFENNDLYLYPQGTPRKEFLTQKLFKKS
ncbi:hypothetical protein V4D30_01100 [Thermodesulfovibrio sp. 3907-1M]|uniref:Uncharacterized protein n=1 Tax=Thermodesulfovibrio autotrophicus TaxID=3118333 RepID=A0AAU8GX02_9BACT